MDIPPRERARARSKLLRAGLIGPGDEGVRADDETLAIFFDTIARQADARAARPGTTIPWDFTDAQPWHLTLERRRGPPRRRASPAERRPHAALVASPTSPTSPPAAPTRAS